MSNQTAKGHSPTNMREEAYQGFMKALLTRELRPGRLVSQREISNIIGCTVSSIREALKRLEGDGIVELIPKRGVMIHEVTQKEILDAYRLRMLIELEAITQYVETHDPKDISAIRTETERLVSTIPDSQAKETELFGLRVELDNKFHRMIVGVLDNNLISSVQKKYEITVLLARLNLPIHFHRQGPAFYEHLTILDAIERRDTNAAKAALETHLESACTRAMQSVDF